MIIPSSVNSEIIWIIITINNPIKNNCTFSYCM